VIEHFSRIGRFDELVQAAMDERPVNQALKSLAKEQLAPDVESASSVDYATSNSQEKAEDNRVLDNPNVLPDSNFQDDLSRTQASDDNANDVFL